MPSIEIGDEQEYPEFEHSEMNIGPVENHRTGREGGGIVYPVYSRRAGGLSLGINLFPDKKYCSFDCPYCEVFPFETDVEFSPDRMEEDLIAAVREAELKRIPVRDISFSGNGEPNLSPFLEEALGRVSLIRDKFLPGTELVLITNGTGLLDEKIFDLLRKAACGPMGLNIWLKLDAGTEDWYKLIDRSDVPFGELIGVIRSFVRCAPVTIQTMICSVAGKSPPQEEAEAWENLVLDLLHEAGNLPEGQGYPSAGTGDRASGIKSIQIYGKARPAPEDPLAQRLPASFLEARAASLRKKIGQIPGSFREILVFP